MQITKRKFLPTAPDIDQLQHIVPSVGTVHVAGTKRAAFQIAEGMEERA